MASSALPGASGAQCGPSKKKWKPRSISYAVYAVELVEPGIREVMRGDRFSGMRRPNFVPGPFCIDWAGWQLALRDQRDKGNVMSVVL